MSLDDTAKALLDRFSEALPEYASMRALFDLDASYHVLHAVDVDGFLVVQERNDQIHVATLHFFEDPTTNDIAALFTVAVNGLCASTEKKLSGALSDRCLYLAENPGKVPILADGFNQVVPNDVVVEVWEEPLMTDVGLTYARTNPYIPRK